MSSNFLDVAHLQRCGVNIFIKVVPIEFCKLSSTLSSEAQQQVTNSNLHLTTRPQAWPGMAREAFRGTLDCFSSNRVAF